MSRLSSTPSSRSRRSSESDTEFWVTLDSKPDFISGCEVLGLDESTQPLSIYSKELGETHSFDVSVELLKRASKQSSPQARYRSPMNEVQIQKQFERSLDMIRKAKNIEVVNSSILMKHSLTKEFEGKLMSIKKTFKQQKEMFRRDVDFLKMELTKKSTETIRLQQMVEEQEVIITQLLLQVKQPTPYFSRDSSDLSLTKPTETPLTATGEFLAEIELAKMQIESLRLVSEQYKRESEEREKTCKELSGEIARNQREFDRERTKLLTEIEQLRHDCMKDRENYEERFRSFRGEANTEAKMHEEIEKRLQAAIGTLQEELRTAKLVLTHPRLRNKVFTRLKDVENAVLELERTTVITPSPSTPGTKSMRMSKRSFFGIPQPHIKVWNPNDHRKYLQMTEGEKEGFERSFSNKRERTSSAQPSISMVEGRRLAL